MTGSPAVHRRRAAGLVALAAAAGLLAAALAPATVLAADPVEITVVSDASWTVTDADAAVGPALSLPGAAQAVCLNASYPVPCPAGAVVYGWLGAGWGADLSSIPGAQWVWAPGIDGATSPADVDTYFFSKTVTIPGTPASGTFWIAADDGAEVFVNGTPVGTSGSPASITSLDIGSHLVTGENELRVRGTNGLICQRDCTYAENPAGVVFGAAITYTPAATPTPDDGAAATAVPTAPPTSTSPAGSASDAGLAVLVALAFVAGLSTLLAARRPARRTR